jgi:hypothetical protein
MGQEDLRACICQALIVVVAGALLHIFAVHYFVMATRKPLPAPTPIRPERCRP